MPSLLTYRQALARALDDIGIYTVASGSGTTVVSAQLFNATASASSGRYNGRWAYINSGAAILQQRRVRSGGYAPSTGTLTIAPDWVTAPTASQGLELTGLFPAIQQTLGEDTDYRSLVNRALGMIVAPDEISLAVTTADEYALTTWQAWLDRPERLVQVLEPSPITSRRPIEVPARGWELVLDAELPKLRTAIPLGTATGNLTLVVRRPADSWIKVSSTWAESAVGLVNDSDEAKVVVEDVVKVGLAQAYQALMSRSPGAPNGTWGAKFKAAQDVARRVQYYDRSLERAVAPSAPVAAIAEETT